MQEIVLSVTRSTMRVVPAAGHGSRADATLTELRDSLLGQGRFARRCFFCDYQFGSIADECEVHHIDGDHGNMNPDNLVPACLLCHLPHHLDLVTKRWPESPGQLIFLPEMSQMDLSSLMQAIVFACASQSSNMNPGEVTSIAESTGQQIYPYVAYSRLSARAAQVEAAAPGGRKIRDGLSSPSVLARVLQAMSEEDYQRRNELLPGVRYLPPLEPLMTIAQHWAVDGGAFKNLDLASWASIHSPQVQPHGG